MHTQGTFLEISKKLKFSLQITVFRKLNRGVSKIVSAHIKHKKSMKTDFIPISKNVLYYQYDMSRATSKILSFLSQWEGGVAIICSK